MLKFLYIKGVVQEPGMSGTKETTVSNSGCSAIQIKRYFNDESGAGRSFFIVRKGLIAV